MAAFPPPARLCYGRSGIMVPSPGRTSEAWSVNVAGPLYRWVGPYNRRGSFVNPHANDALDAPVEHDAGAQGARDSPTTTLVPRSRARVGINRDVLAGPPTADR